MLGNLLGTYETQINGQRVTVKRYASPSFQNSKLGMTKSKRQKNKGREAGGRHIAKERE